MKNLPDLPTEIAADSPPLSRPASRASPAVGGKRLPLLAPLCLGLCLAVVLLLGYATGRLGTPHKLVDSDSYMWLLHTERWHNGASWYDLTSPRSNAPYGETLHWGRPFDLVLLGPALVLAPFFGFHHALWLWGLAVGPVLLVPTVVLFVWSLRPLLTPFQLLLACGLFLSNPAIVLNFYPAQPDHKSLNTLLFVAALGCSIRVLRPPFRAGPIIALGLVFALGLWSSMEMLFAIGVLQGILALLWVWEGGEWAQRACRLSLSTAVFAAIALLISRPWSVLPDDFEVDQLSSLQVILLGLLVPAWFVLGKFATVSNRIVRLLSGAAAAVAIAGFIYRLHPTFFRGPFGDVDPEVWRIWLSHVQTTTPLVAMGGASLASILYLLGMALIALPASFVIAAKAKSPDQAAWIFLAGNLATGLALSLFVADRWSAQASLCALGPLAVMLPWLVPEGRGPAAVRLLLLLMVGNAGVVLSFLPRSFPVVAGASIQPVRATRSMAQLPTLELAQFLDGPRFPAPQRILTHLDLSAELMYRTSHETIATPYHRNTAGILDDFHVMEARDDAVAQAILRRRGVTLILVCPTLDESQTYYDLGTPGTLYERLVENRPPAWLKPVELPAPLREDFQLWAVSLDLP